MTATYGQATTIEQIPFPAAAVNIVSSTNASPTVITATSHGLHTGEIAILNGHLINTAANGIFAVTVLSANTFKISTLSGFPGTFVNGVGVGGATGTVQSLALPGVTLPQDTADDMDAASVNVPFEALLDMTADLAYRALAATTILRGGSWQLLAGSTGAVQAGAIQTVYGALSLDTDGVFKPTFSLLDGTIALRTPQRFGDVNQTNVNVLNGHEVILSTAATTARTITFLAPSRDGLWFDVSLHVSASPGSTKYYELKRDGSANYLCRLSGWSTDLATDLGSGRVRLIADGGVWRVAGGVGILLGADA